MSLSLSMMQAFPCIYRLFLLSLLEDNEQFQTRDDSTSRKRERGSAAQAAA